MAPPLFSTTIITYPRRPSLTLQDSWVAILSSLVVLACLTVTLDEPGLGLVRELGNKAGTLKPLLKTFILLLNKTV